MKTTSSVLLLAIKATKGKFASVTYTNAKGETKPYIIRTGVKKHLRGGSKPVVEDSVTVYALNAQGYKTFKAEGIQKVKCGSLNLVKG